MCRRRIKHKTRHRSRPLHGLSCFNREEKKLGDVSAQGFRSPGSSCVAIADVYAVSADDSDKRQRSNLSCLPASYEVRLMVVYRCNIDH
jgi:hypothetical protein